MSDAWWRCRYCKTRFDGGKLCCERLRAENADLKRRDRLSRESIHVLRQGMAAALAAVPEHETYDGSPEQGDVERALALLNSLSPRKTKRARK